MRSSTWASSATWLLLSSPVLAFYPYIPPYWKGDNPDQRRAALQPIQDDALQAGSVTLPLHRTPIRRDNKYSIQSAQTPTQSNSVGVDQDGMDYTYFSTMKFGTSDKQYHMLMDTAASNTWVMSSDCTTDVCNAHNTLGKAQSSSLNVGTTTFAITYGTGSVNGTTATDTAHFAGNDVSLTFGLATGVSSEFRNYALDGILGFGRGASDPGGVNAPSIIDVLASNSLIKARLIGVHLSRAKSNTNDGQLNLGAPNPSLYDGDLAYIPVEDNDRGFWEIPLDDAGFAGKMGGITGQTAIIDTGTSFMLIPPAAAKTLHGLIPGSSQSGESYTVPCSSTDSVQLVFGGKTYNISAADYVGASAGSGACHSNIIGRQTFDDNQWLVGDVFLKNVYTVFDFDGKRVAFGIKSGSTSMGQTTSSPSTTASSASSSATPGSTLSAATKTGPSSSGKSSSMASSTVATGTPTASTPVPLNPGATTLATSGPTEAGSAAQTQSTTKSQAPSSIYVSMLLLIFSLLLSLAAFV